MKRSWTTFGLVLIPGVLWGMAFIVIDVILREIPPYTLTAMRSLITAVAMIGILYSIGGRLPYTWQGWQPYVLLGIFNNAFPFSLLALGQTYIPSGLATILTSAMPLFTILLAHFYTNEKLTWLKGVGMMVGFSGVFVLVGPSALLGVRDSFIGQMLIVTAAFCYAVGNIMIKGFFSRVEEAPPETGNKRFQFLMEVSATQFVVATVVLAPVSLLIDRPWLLSPSWQTWGLMIVLALFFTVIAGVVYYYLIDTAGSGVGATSIFVIPIAGVLGSAYFLGQAITLQIVVALVFVLVGVGLVNRG